jgi:endo-1,3(4)-beta-glucanase
LPAKRTPHSPITHSIFALLWSGKADYATFFDAAPESKLAIQLIPMTPAAGYLGTDTARVLLNHAQIVRETGQAPSKFKDYIVMYKALADPKAALAEAAAMGDADIDDGNSRSYLFAWLMTR